MWAIVVDLKVNFPCWVAIDTLSLPNPFHVYPTNGQYSSTNLQYGDTIQTLLDFIDSCVQKESPIALGFEAPMYWAVEHTHRFDKEPSPWWVQAASQATAQAYFFGNMIFQHFRLKHSHIDFTFNLKEVSARKLLLFEAFAYKDFKAGSINGDPNGYTVVAASLPFGIGQNHDDWVDAFYCTVSFIAYYFSEIHNNRSYLDAINSTLTQRILYKKQKSYKLQALRVDLQGIKILGSTQPIVSSLTQSVRNHWTVLLSGILEQHNLGFSERCEIFGIKFR